MTRDNDARFATLPKGEHQIRCKACDRDSGVSGQWKHRPNTQTATSLRKIGWACLHAGHLPGMNNDPRVWVCPQCQPAWREQTQPRTRVRRQIPA
jgi:hypothetical protein